MRQLDQKALGASVTRAADNLRNSRKANKTYYDQHKQLRTDSQQLHVGDLVLLHRTGDTYSRVRAKKLDDRWFGPYRITEIPQNSTFYRLEELDGTPLAATVAGNRLKRFFPRTELDNHRSEAHVTIRVWDALGVSDDETANGDVRADGDDQPITEEGGEERGLMGDEAIERR
jgi:hypothetical protein